MANIIEITDFSAPELDVYARLTEGQLLNRHEPEKGMFIAESPRVIERALDAGCRPVSFLAEGRHVETQAAELIRRCGDVPVYTADFEVLKHLTGFPLTRGMLCAMRRPALPSVEEVCAGAKRIAVLEDELGVKLFVRDSRGVTLTPEGDKVLAYAERMMDTMHALKQSLDTGASTQGRIRIGAMDTVIHTWLSPLVARVTETFPAVEIELMADTARNLSEQLQKGYLDLIFQTDSLRHESVLNLELGSYPLRWIVSTGSIYHRDYASLADLARERVVTFSKHSRPHQDVLGLLHANGVAAPRLNCVNSVAAMTRLLRDGFGVGALPPALVSQELERGELTLLRLGPPPPNLPVVVSWRGGTGLELVDEVVELSKTVLADYAANVGPECMLLAPLKKGVGRLRSR